MCKRAEQDLNDSVIKAPFAGVITRRLVDTGANVASAPPTDVVEVQEVSRLFLECSIPQEQATGIASGTRLRFRINGADREAAVTTVFPQVDAATRSLRLRAEIANEDGALKPGSLVEVTILR
jgi:membrane fusion protein (multidrug efflux system)